jgi:hypothetical protein
MAIKFGATMSDEQVAALVKERDELKTKAAVKPSFFSTTAGSITVGVVGLAAGIGGGYLLFSSKDEQPAKK